MHTRIILHGGNSSKESDKNYRFFSEVISGVNKSTVTVLCVYFARPQRRWEDSFAEDRRMFRSAALKLGMNAELTLATYDIESLLGDIEKTDVIFINGGARGYLKDTLLAIGVGRFRHLIQGKTLVGVSAGANMIGRYYYSQIADTIREGIGLEAIKVLTHYSTDEPYQFEMLTRHEEDLPIVTVAEEEYVILQ